SNVMLVDPNNERIIDSLKHVSFSQNRYRTILPGQTYKLPPDQGKFHPLELSEEDFIKKLDFNAGRMDRQIVQVVDGFSPVIAKELVHRTNLGSQTAYKEKFAELKQQIQNNDYAPTI